MNDIVIAGCLRNAKAVAEHINALNVSSVMLVAAGERWYEEEKTNSKFENKDDGLRPCFEDLIACGAIAKYLIADLTPEAIIAKASFIAVERELEGHMKACLSGVELMDRGYEIDVEWASDLNSDDCVPILQETTQQYVDFGVNDLAIKLQKVKFYKP